MSELEENVFLALASDSTEQLDRLLGKDKTLLIDGLSLLHLAINMGSRSIAESLLDSRIDFPPDPDGSNVVYYCAARGELELITRAIALGYGIDERNFVGQTPLMVSARFGNLAVCRLLLDEGANPRPKDNFGLSVLHHAVALQDNVDTVVLLIEHGADALDANDEGLSAIDYARALGRKQCESALAGSVVASTMRKTH